MKKTLIAVSIAVSSFLLPVTANAGDSPVVVELFTSQGCSSCPPADKVLHKLAKRDDVLALALHVDYWDYIGWKDEFAQPAFGKRQKAYAHRAQRRVVYTPQMIIGGRQNVEGAHPMQIMDAISEMENQLVDVGLQIRRRGDRLTVSADKSNLEGAVNVQLVRFSPDQKVKILRGENRGKNLRYSNVVTSWKALRSWDGKSDLKFSLDVEGKDKIAIILQYPGPGQIVAAAQIH